MMHFLSPLEEIYEEENLINAAVRICVREHIWQQAGPAAEG